MDYAGRYARACWPDTWRVAGVRLKPYCLGHALLLQRIDSPLTVDTRPDAGIPATALVTAVFICSRDWWEASEAIGKRLPSGWWLRSALLLLLFALRPLTLWQAVGTFDRYVVSAWDYPDIWTSNNDGDSREPGSPHLASLKQAGMRLGYSEADTLSMPLALLLWEIAVRGEMEGRHEVVNESEAEAMKG